MAVHTPSRGTARIPVPSNTAIFLDHANRSIGPILLFYYSHDRTYMYSSAASRKISKPAARSLCNATGSTGSPVSISSKYLVSAPLTPLARCAQYESTEMRSSRGSNRRINGSVGFGNSIGSIAPRRPGVVYVSFSVCSVLAINKSLLVAKYKRGLPVVKRSQTFDGTL